LESHPAKVLENVIFATNLYVVDEHGNDVTAAVKAAVANGSANSGLQPTREEPRAADAERWTTHK
jgi:hypothetical protein